MAQQFEPFKEKAKKDKRKRRKPEFESIEEGWGVNTIEKTEVEQECFACGLPIPEGSKVEKRTPIVDGRELWYQSIYKHNPACPPAGEAGPLPEDEPANP